MFKSVLSAKSNLEKRYSITHGISHTDIIKSIISKLYLGKSDFEAIENHRGDDYFKAVLTIDRVRRIYRR
jgi:hypothetical protein